MFVTFDVLLLGFVGVVGCILGFMVGVSEHDVTQPNWNLLWAWPTHLIAAGVLLTRGWGSSWMGWGLRGYFGVTAAAMAVVAVAWWALPQELPGALWFLAVAVGVRSAGRGWRTPTD